MHACVCACVCTYVSEGLLYKLFLWMTWMTDRQMSLKRPLYHVWSVGASVPWCERLLK